jgi:hypothetical protein
VPSSMIFLGLVVVWLLILVPAVARHRQEVARPSSAALSARVLDRPRRDRGTDRDTRGPVGARDEEVDVIEHDTGHDEERRSVAVADEQHPPPTADERGWDRPPPRYRRGRGGFDPEAAALAARARFAFRQRVVLAMLVLAAGTALVAGLLLPWVWWAHGAVDAALVGYLVYLRRQVRLEESIRRRRAARMAGTRRPSAAEDPDLDEWARRGRVASGDGRPGRETVADAVRRAAQAEAARDEYDDDYDEYDDERDGYDGVHRDARTARDAAGRGDAEDGDRADDEHDELAREEPERVAGTGAPLWRGPGPGLEMMEVESALPRLQPVPTPPLPAGTALVETDADDPDLHDLDGPMRPDYRRAVGE